MALERGLGGRGATRRKQAHRRGPFSRHPELRYLAAERLDGSLGGRMGDVDARRTNAAIAANYDAVGYVGHGYSGLDPERLVGLASLFAPTRWPTDVLDLGCGDGVHLAQVAGKIDGRLVGTDISGQACARARERLGSCGERVEIRCEDLLDLNPRDLGEFDLIYNIGVIYVTPIEVQKRIIEIIGRCLRPGGIAVISYYAGSKPAIHATLSALLHATVREMTEYAEVIAHVRRQMQDLRAAIQDPLILDVLAEMEKKPDPILFHESLNHGLRPMQTTALEMQFREFGVEFAAYLLPNGTLARRTSAERAVAADVYDFLGGGYQYALFGKQPMQGGAQLDTSATPFGSELRENAEPGANGGVKFSQPNGVATLTNEASIAVLRSLAEGPRLWSDILASIDTTTGSRRQNAEEFRQQAMNDLEKLLDTGLIYPMQLPP
jgi:SAM-dependent methyltransferase